MQAVRKLMELGLAEIFPAEPKPRSGKSAPPSEPVHELAVGESLYAYMPPACRRPLAGHEAHPPLFSVLSPDLSPEEVARETNLFVFVGAGDSRAFEWALEQKGLLKLVFEPDRSALVEYLEKSGPDRFQGRNVAFFGGDHASRPAPLAEALLPAMEKSMFPVAYVRSDLAGPYGEWVEEIVRYLEILYFRFRVYPFEGQSLRRSVPVRPIRRDLFHDPQRHLYENCVELLRRGNIRRLRGVLAGGEALIVGAGPDLDQRLDFVRRASERVPVIAVCRAVKTLRRAGVTPHFVVVNDNSMAAARLYEDLDGLSESVLVAHCLSPVPKELFSRIYFFGAVLPDILGKRLMLNLHGSVITTTFSLARHMGCVRCYMAGAQLASYDPWNLSYSHKSDWDIKGYARPPGKELTNSYPQLVPVKNAGGETVYTSLNFLDAAVWFQEEIRASGLEVVNLSPESIVHGPGIRVDANPDLPEDGGMIARVAGLRPEPDSIPLEPVQDWVLKELNLWRTVRKGCAAVLGQLKSGDVSGFEMLLERFDEQGITYLVEGYGDFNNKLFSRDFFSSDNPMARKRAALDYVVHCLEMAEGFRDLLAERYAEIKDLIRGR